MEKLHGIFRQKKQCRVFLKPTLDGVFQLLYLAVAAACILRKRGRRAVGHIKYDRFGELMIRYNVNSSEKKGIFPMGLIGNAVTPWKAKKIIGFNREAFSINSHWFDQLFKALFGVKDGLNVLLFIPVVFHFLFQCLILSRA